MKVYKIVIDYDRGKDTTEIRRTEMYFAANTVGEIFNEAIIQASREGGDIVGIVEICQNLMILGQ